MLVHLRPCTLNPCQSPPGSLCPQTFHSANGPSKQQQRAARHDARNHQLPSERGRRMGALKQGQAEAERQAAGEWAALAFSEDTEEEQIPQGLQEKLNKICNAGLKLMLKDCSIREIEEYKDKVSELGASFSEQNDLQGATFAYVLYSMAEHKHVKALDNLQGVYKAACLKMFGLLEDSGWKLSKEGEEDTEMPEDEQALPDVPTLGSYSGII